MMLPVVDDPVGEGVEPSSGFVVGATASTSAALGLKVEGNVLMLCFATAGLPATAPFELLSGGVCVVPVVVVQSQTKSLV